MKDISTVYSLVKRAVKLSQKDFIKNDLDIVFEILRRYTVFRKNMSISALRKLRKLCFSLDICQNRFIVARRVKLAMFQ